jgi:hypothetical protein
MTSEAASDARIDIRDKQTGAHIAFTLPAQKAALALVGTREKAVVAKYGF